MENKKSNLKIIILYTFIIISFGCNRNHISMTFEDVFVQKNENMSDDPTVLFYVKVINSTSKDIVLDEEGYAKSEENSGFYLISDQFYSGAIKLNPTADADERRIISGHVAKLTLILFINKLRSSLLNYNHEKYSYDDLKTFIKRGNYSLVYISFKTPQTLNVLKSKSFKVLELDSANHNTLDILKP
jgi:hypothetical protein